MLKNRITGGLILIAGAPTLAAGPAGRVLRAQADAGAPARDDKDVRRFRVESLRGRVVWLHDALAQRLGVQTVPESRQRVLALATRDGHLIPLIEDVRGRAFRLDERLREMHVELVVRRYEATPSIQILRVYEWKDEQKSQVDYWCDVCAIVMFEKGPCACCQDDNRLRQRPVEDAAGRISKELAIPKE